MEMYTLDELLRNIEVIDVFESLIWAERFSVSGDFEIVLPATPNNSRLLREGTLVTVNDSMYVGKVETITKKLDDDSKEMLEVKGFFLEETLKGRVAKKTMKNLTEEPDWELEGTPRDILKQIFYHICLEGALSPDDILPFLKEGDLIVTPGSWASLDPTLHWGEVPPTLHWAEALLNGPIGDGDTGDDIIVTNKPDSLYDIIKTMCDVFNLGFRIVRNGNKSELYFEVYPGVDRTSLQTTFMPVMFSTDLDNLLNSTEYSSTSESKNVAYVFSKHGSAVVNPAGGNTPSGFDRKVIFVDANDVEEEAGPTLDRILQQRGLEELAKHKPIFAFDGEISKHTEFEYMVHYNLGDIVELKDSTGNISRMRVGEVIRIHDNEGYRIYPTVVVEDRIDKGTWASLPPSLYWQNAQGYWADA